MGNWQLHFSPQPRYEARYSAVSFSLFGRYLGQRHPTSRLVHCPSAFHSSPALCLSLDASLSRALTFNSTNSPRFKDPCQRIESRSRGLTTARRSLVNCYGNIEVDGGLWGGQFVHLSTSVARIWGKMKLNQRLNAKTAHVPRFNQ